MEVVGTVGAIIGIIDVATRSITTLAKIRRQFKEANLTLELLHGQLVTVKTALQQIQQLVDESLQGQQHYQLVMNMHVSINCCHLLLGILDEQISKLEFDNENNVNLESKIKVVLESKGTEDCLQRLDRQVAALNLVITAFSARDTSAQKELMEDEASQQVFERVKDDSSSLLVLYDDASFITKRTMTSTATSRFSRNFTFDNELLQHKVYKSTIRSLLRRATANPKDRGSDKGQSTSSQATRREEAKIGAKTSKSIDAILRDDHKRMNSEVMVMVCGKHASHVACHIARTREGKTDIELVASQRHEFRKSIYYTLIPAIQKAIDINDKRHIDRGLKFREQSSILATATMDDASYPLRPEIHQALRFCAKALIQWSVWQDLMPQFFEHIESILNDTYEPSAEDMLSITLHGPGTGMQETQFQSGTMTYRFLYSFPTSRKADHVFENICASIFTVDLISCIEPEAKSEPNSGLACLLEDFKQFISSRWCRDKAIILILTNQHKFSELLKDAPLGPFFFSDYAGGNDYFAAMNYISNQFRMQCEEPVDFYPHPSNVYTDPHLCWFVLAAVNDVVIKENLRVKSMLKFVDW